ncbi:ABC transporter permease [Cohnella lubricantis]|uniref:ABC transporter permease n=1 Tax=Cohnella lubricantis TaxID=2163172 RepID=A0A841T7L6_9BACL|nr:ABC transporter permease [Cohnella lubricantis]MBB6676089.1 ABC transporter permease [Cohnella lubricantis]MBP2118046.1 ABC-2 type transport system permease protein [Cohnella lubricantis]
MNMLTALWAESLKVRRSRIIWISLMAATLLPILFGLVMAGLISSKPALEGQEANMQAYLNQLGVAVSVGGIIGFGFLYSWIFGREYSDRTVKDLLALPVPRFQVVLSKMFVAALWCAALAAWLFAVGCATGWLVSLDGWSGGVIADSLPRYAETTIMVICLSLPIGWIASAGRGYMAALGFVVLMVIAANLGGAIGIESYMPWAVPGLLNGAAGEDKMNLEAVSLALPYVTGAVGIAGTIAWWRYADQT